MRRILFFLMILMFLLVGSSWAANMKSIAKDRVNVRSRPNLKSEVLFQVGLGCPIEVARQRNNWVFFHDWQDNSGWVHKPLVSSIHTVVIIVENANIRKGPGLRNPAVGQASKGEIYRVFGERGSWVKIGYYLENEVIGWVREDLVWGE